MGSTLLPVLTPLQQGLRGYNSSGIIIIITLVVVVVVVVVVKIMIGVKTPGDRQGG